jgi:hypothetical protein
VEDGFAHVPAGQRMELRYEDLIADPLPTLRRVADYAGLPVSPVWKQELEGLRFANRNNAWRTSMDGSVVARITELQQPLLSRYGYG